MKRIFLLSCIAGLFAACDGHPEADKQQATDSVTMPDSVPRMVRVGKEADWAYKPDSMINEILIGDAASLVAYKRDNGNRDEKDQALNELVYVNSLETEQLTVFEEKTNDGWIPYGFVVKKNVREQNSPPASNYATARNFLTGAGIYIGMPPDYVQNMYKSQPMMQWIKNDTTYLSYTPSEKDKEHYKRYSITDYHALYKFVNDKCVVMETFVDPKAFAK